MLATPTHYHAPLCLHEGDKWQLETRHDKKNEEEIWQSMFISDLIVGLLSPFCFN